MQRIITSLALTVAFGLSGCAGLFVSESAQLASTGPVGLNHPCTFGGVTPRAQRHCLGLTYGPEGQFVAIRDEALRTHPGPDNCGPVTEQVLSELEKAGYTKLGRIYTEVAANPHVSAVVEHEGELWVIDNGGVSGLPMGIATLAQYRNAVAEYEMDWDQSDRRLRASK